MMNQSPRKMLLPPRGKRKRQEDIALGSTSRGVSKPLSPAPTAPVKDHKKPKPSNMLLAGYLANEFLTNGTLFGRTLESAKARPSPFIHSSYLDKPKKGTKQLQQASTMLDSSSAEPKNKKKLPQQVQGKPDTAKVEPKNEKKLPQQAQGKPDTAKVESKNEKKLPQQAQGKPDTAKDDPKNKRKLPAQGKPGSTQVSSSTEPKRKKAEQPDSEAKSRNLDYHYREVTKLLQTKEVRIPGIVNPKHLYQWMRRW